MAYTTHGAHIPGTSKEELPSNQICKDVWQCLNCMRQAALYHNTKESNNADRTLQP